MPNLIERLNILIGRLKLLVGVNNLSTPQGQKIYEIAKKYLGVDASPRDIAPDELGCAETISEILMKSGFSQPLIISTTKFYTWLNDDRDWVSVTNPLAGDIIISPTGMGGKNGIRNGHIGIVGINGVIMSNSSLTGRFEPNYTLSSWARRYLQLGGYPIYYFRRVL